MTVSRIKLEASGRNGMHCTLPLPALSLEVEEQKRKKGDWLSSERSNIYDITDEAVARNTWSVASCWQKTNLIDNGDGTMMLNTKKFSETYSLCACEPFYNEPVCAGFSCTAVLVAKNIIATAPHFVNQNNLEKLCFFFGFIMVNPLKAITWIPVKDIYYGVNILHQSHDDNNSNNSCSDWVLVQLDRNVKGREIASLSSVPVFNDQPIYVFGHPCGLPLKYTAGGKITSIKKNHFKSKISLYNCNSGSPTFCAETHEMIGLVSASDPIDFKWVNGCCVSVRYPNRKVYSKGACCTKVSEFSDFIDWR